MDSNCNDRRDAKTRWQHAHTLQLMALRKHNARQPTLNPPKPRDCRAPGVACGEADALNARHVVHVGEQVSEGVGAPPAGVLRKAGKVAAVRVDVLPQQRHLLVPGLAERQHLAPVAGICEAMISKHMAA